MTMEQYNNRIRDGTSQNLVRPIIQEASMQILDERQFQNLLKELIHDSFYGKDLEDTHKHIDEMIDIVDYFNILGSH